MGLVGRYLYFPFRGRRVLSRPLMWGATCFDPYAPSHLRDILGSTGATADSAEDLKSYKNMQVSIELT